MFKYGKPVMGDSFFDRKLLKKQVENFIRDGVDFMIKAPRRYGKTSLVINALRSKDYIYLDFRRVPRLSMVPEELLEQAYEIAGFKGFLARVKENVVSLIKDARVSAKVDIAVVELGAEIVLRRDDEKSGCEKMIAALDVVEMVGESLGKKITVVFDEFQDIKRLECEDGDILEVLRGTLQHKKHIHSIFLGSIESIMIKIFENKRSPFFNYCRKFTLDPFDTEELLKELTAAFKKKRIVFESKGSFKAFIERLGGHPANTMQAMQALYYLCLEKDILLVKEQHLQEAYERAYYEQLDLIEQYASQMKRRKHYYDVMYRMARGEEQKLTSQALYQVRKGLVDMGFLMQRGKDDYAITDPFLEAYLKEELL